MPPRIVDDNFILELVNQTTEAQVLDLSAEAAFEPLVQLLNYNNINEPSEAIRGQVIHKLSAFGSKAVAPLISYLVRPDNGDKNYGQTVARTALMSVAYGSAGKDDRTYSRAMAAQELGNSGDKTALPALVQTLQSAQMWYLLTSVAGAIRTLADESILESLLNILIHHENVGNRKFAANALTGIPHAETIKALITALKDESADVAVAAAHSLGNLRAESAITALKDATSDERQVHGRSGGEIRVCQAAVNALREIGTKEAIEIAVNWDIETLQTNPDPELRYSAAYNLVVEDDSRVVDVLINAMSDNGMTGHPLWESVSKAAQDTLEKIGSREAIEALVKHNLELLKHGQAQERIDAIFRLKKYDDKQVLPALAEALFDEMPQPHSKRTVSHFAQIVLESLNTDEAKEAINRWKSKTGKE